MFLSEIIEVIKPINIIGNTNIDIKNISYDSRKVDKHSIFIALSGNTVDGHNFIQQAVNNGAVAVLGEKPIKDNLCTYIQVDDSLAAMAKVACKFFNYPSDELKIIGITGTNGKTTSTFIIKSILEAANSSCGLIGTLKYLINDIEYPAPNTTPQSLDVQKMFREMRNQSINHVVMEVTSHALELNRVDGIDFDIGVFTNLTQDHLDFHQSLENYFKAKQKLFTSLNNSKKKGLAIINIDDPYGERLVKECSVPVITYSINNNADIKVTNYDITSEGSTLNIRYPDGNILIKANLHGLFNVYNILSAFSVGYALNIPIDNIAKGIENIHTVSGRFESVNCGQKFLVIVDYAHTPDAVSRVLQAVREVTKGKVITVFGCGGDRDPSKRPIMGNYASTLSDYCVVTSDNPRTEKPDSIIDDILKGMSDQVNFIVEPNRHEAIKLALSKAQENDTVAILGKGHEDYQIIGTTKLHFDDREEVRNFFIDKKTHA